MNTATTVSDRKRIAQRQRASSLRKSLPYFLILIPGALYFILFRYVPMWGLMLSFKNYKPVYGFLNSAWVGLDNFRNFFTHEDFPRLIVNTLRLALNSIVFYFPVPILLALLINEVRSKAYRRIVQSITYIPHFISWVVIAGISQQVFGDRGLINGWRDTLGLARIPFLYSEGWFRPIVLIQVLWKEVGWGTVIFVAALTAVNPDLYEAATIDGAGRARRLWHVTLPAIRSTIVVMLILRVGRFLDTGFEQIFLLLNAMNRQVGEVFDTYVYEIGIREGRFSFAVTASVFKSVIGFVLVLMSDKLAKFFGEEGIL